MKSMGIPCVLVVFVRRFVLLLVIFLLTACGSTSSIKLDLTQPSEVGFQLSDTRPMDGRVSGKQASSIGTTTYYGDDYLTPPPSELMKSYLANRLPELLSGKVLILTEFYVKVLDPTVSIDAKRFDNATQTVPNASPAAVLLAAPLILVIESISGKKHVSVSIQGSIDDKRFSGFSLQSFRGRVTEEDVRSVILAALDDVAVSIKKALDE